MSTGTHGFDRDLYAAAWSAIHGEPTSANTFASDYRAAAGDVAMDRAVELCDGDIRRGMALFREVVAAVKSLA
jgi:hypothetical protein